MCSHHVALDMTTIAATRLSVGGSIAHRNLSPVMILLIFLARLSFTSPSLEETKLTGPRHHVKVQAAAESQQPQTKIHTLPPPSRVRVTL
jgi:hypothetical protein